MKKVASITMLMLFGLILVHSVIPHDHGEEALSGHPTLTSTTTTHQLLFLEIDLGEDHLEEYDQPQHDFVFIAESTLLFDFKRTSKSLIHQDDRLQRSVRPLTQPYRGPPAV